MKLASLGSGSKGNATVIEAQGERLLVDCGFGLKEIEQRLAAKGVTAQSLSAILITHEHGDHLKGAPMLANRYKIPLWVTHGTARAIKRPVEKLKLFKAGDVLSIGPFEVKTVTVPHDGAEPAQFVIGHQNIRAGLLTDIGFITNQVIKEYQQCDLLLLECNHDPEMLRVGPYPPSLKVRVGGDYGHLSNQQAAQMLSTVDKERLRHVLVSHISEQNNDKQLVQAALAAEIKNHDVDVQFLSQQEGCDWIQLSHTG
ncbi:MBL fold metallo-hydrolase [Reinekea thalattae]|uniref:MBL fold metallo-hydrolase n=1 Tax=Reinekea thalattae TaxID=2593301 RepID=A0A5C8Z9P8_9GAMM|nr:MBL fold metallo-hydrolase [Reinekea thalattae]TXR54009.1 MBL fold metallo-hydrolase [Reinekea thalattae]